MKDLMITEKIKASIFAVVILMVAIISIAAQTEKTPKVILSDEDIIREIVFFKEILPKKVSDIGNLKDFYSLKHASQNYALSVQDFQ